MSKRYPKNDNELKARVRDETSYEDTADELPSSQLDGIVEAAKGRVELETGSDQWYADDGLGFVLAAYTAMRAKAAIENVPLASYSIGDEQVTFDDDTVEDSAQYQQWAEDIRIGLDASSLDDPKGPTLQNSTGYIGETHTPERDHDGRLR